MELVEPSVETYRSEKREGTQLVVMRLLLTGRAEDQENGLEAGRCEASMHLSFSIPWF